MVYRHLVFYVWLDFGVVVVPCSAQLVKRITELFPSYDGGHNGLAITYGRMKMYDEMEEETKAYARVVQSGFPRIGTYIDATTAYRKGDKETVRRMLPELEAHLKEACFMEYGAAELHFFLGDVDKGFEWLERAYSERNGGLLGILSDQDLDGVRTNPRYLDLLKRLGLDQTSKPS